MPTTKTQEVRTLFLTGANSGIGFATAKLFLSKGWNVFATARSPSAATELQAHLVKGDSAEGGGDYSSRLAIHPIDLLDASTFQPAVDAAIARFGVIDVLLNNAGYGQLGLFEQLSMEDWRRQFEIELTKTVLPHFHATADPSRPRSILFTSSGAASFSLPLMGAYSASKSALDLAVEALHYELGSLPRAGSAGGGQPIAVKIVVPYGGVSETNFTASGSSSPHMAQLFGGNSNDDDDDDDGDGDEGVVVRARYGGLAASIMRIFERWGAKSMPASAPASTVWTAVTDGRTDRLRYFIGPQDGGPALRKRMRLGDGEMPDEVDGRYVTFMKGMVGL